MPVSLAGGSIWLLTPSALGDADCRTARQGLFESITVELTVSAALHSLARMRGSLGFCDRSVSEEQFSSAKILRTSDRPFRRLRLGVLQERRSACRNVALLPGISYT